MTTSFSFGDIVSIDVVFSDQSDSKIRPVLILKKDRKDYLLMSLTGNESNKQSGDLLLVPNEHNNLRAPTIARIGKLHTYHEMIIRKKIGSLTLHEKTELKKHVKALIDSL